MVNFKTQKMKLYLVSYIMKNGLVRDEEVIAKDQQQARTIAQYNFRPDKDKKIVSIDFQDFAENYNFIPYIMSYINIHDDRTTAIVYGDTFTESLLEISEAIADDIKEIISYRKVI